MRIKTGAMIRQEDGEIKEKKILEAKANFCHFYFVVKSFVNYSE